MWKVSIFGILLVRIFLHSDWINPNMETFYAVSMWFSFSFQTMFSGYCSFQSFRSFNSILYSYLIFEPWYFCLRQSILPVKYLSTFGFNVDNDQSIEKLLQIIALDFLPYFSSFIFIVSHLNNLAIVTSHVEHNGLYSLFFLSYILTLSFPMHPFSTP